MANDEEMHREEGAERRRRRWGVTDAWEQKQIP